MRFFCAFTWIRPPQTAAPVYHGRMREPTKHQPYPIAAIKALSDREAALYTQQHPRSAALAARSTHWFTGAPLHWMQDWPLPFPLAIAKAQGARLTDVDGRPYADFCLGDTAAMFGHSPAPLAEALSAQVAQGLSAMLPAAATAEVGELLAKQFGLAQWQIATTASDANRFLLRWARAATGRSVVLVFDGCYHGAVDDTQVELANGHTQALPGQVGRVIDVTRTTRVVAFNDVEALRDALAPGDVAAVLCEPALTNCGMVLPDPGFHTALRELTHQYGTLLLIDETHTLSAGPQGYTGAFGLAPDAMVIGKAIAGGVPCAVYGVTESLAGRMHQAWREAGPGRTGIGTTLSGSLLQIAALHATLTELITEAHYARMFDRTAHYAGRVREVLDRHALDWTLSVLGARSELQYTDRAPRTAREAASGFDAGLEALIQLYLLNRGVVLTPFHHMALMSPATSLDDVEALVDGLDACLTELGETPR